MPSIAGWLALEGGSRQEIDPGRTFHAAAATDQPVYAPKHTTSFEKT